MFYSSLSELSYFEEYNKNGKDNIIKELLKENEGNFEGNNQY